MTAEEARKIVLNSQKEKIDLESYLEKVYAAIESAARQDQTSIDYRPLEDTFPQNIKSSMLQALRDKGYQFNLERSPNGKRIITW